MERGVVLSDTMFDDFGVQMLVTYYHFIDWFSSDWTRPINKRKPSYITEVLCYVEFPNQGYHINYGYVSIYTFWSDEDLIFYHDLIFTSRQIKGFEYTIRMDSEQYINFITDNNLVNDRFINKIKNE